MAEALVSYILEELGSVIFKQIENEFVLVAGVKKEIKKLTFSFRAIQAMLKDAERKQFDEKDEKVKLWLEEFKDVAYDMEDILDEWTTAILMRSRIDHEGPDGEGTSNNNNKNKNKNKKKQVSSYLCSLCTCFGKTALRHEIGSKIKEVRERLDFIEKEKNRYKLIESEISTVDDHHDVEAEQLKSSSVIDVSDVCGRDHDKEVILSKLVGESSSSNTQNQLAHTLTLPIVVISIVGMGGLGKTTLAQLVYSHENKSTHFEKFIWVAVSDPFDRTRIAKEIILGVGDPLPCSSEWNTLHDSLSQSVRGKRVLLVLDDIWIEDQNKWDPFKISLKNAAQQSCILVTTRNKRVAEMMESTYIHPLGTLTNEESWSLLSRIAFSGRNKEKEHDEDFIQIGTKIANMCNGLPLSCKALGSLLRFKKTAWDWRDVMESEFWKIKEVENGVLKPALLLSYFNLPSPVKACFAYCAIFPKDYNIEKDELIKLWMAQDLLRSTTRDEAKMEETGEEYFNILAMRCFFQNFVEDDHDNITHCKMHDLVHDFAHFLTEKQCVIPSSNNYKQRLSENILKVRHLTLEYGEDEVDSSSFYDSMYKVKNLRTLQFLNSGWIFYLNEIPSDLCHHLRCLRVLQLKNTGLHRLPSQIGKLIHLRYLDLSRNDELKELPDSICSLYNLQILNLNGCCKLSNLPKGMGRLINLRHLMIEETDDLKSLPQGMGKLTSLRTLDKFIVGGGCHIQELKGLNLLEGRIKISGLGSPRAVNEVCEAILKEKKHLHTLDLYFGPNQNEVTDSNEGESELSVVERMEGVLQEHQPHRNLKELYITDYPGFKFPNWISDLYQLQRLELNNCINCTELPALGKLSSLEVLKIDRFPKLKTIGRANQVAFPKLTELYIKDLDSLEEWDLIVAGEDAINIMPCLRKLYISGIGKLKVLPAFGRLPSLEDLYIKGAREVERIGSEFYGIGGVDGVSIAFPKLTRLEFWDTSNLEEWELGEEEKDKWNRGEILIMPCLRQVVLRSNRLRKVSALGKLPCLEELEIGELNEMRHIGPQFFGIDSVTVVRVLSK